MSDVTFSSQNVTFQVRCDAAVIRKSFLVLPKMWRFSWTSAQMWRFRHIVTSFFWVRLGTSLGLKTWPGSGFQVLGFSIWARNNPEPTQFEFFSNPSSTRCSCKKFGLTDFFPENWGEFASNAEGRVRYVHAHSPKTPSLYAIQIEPGLSLSDVRANWAFFGGCLCVFQCLSLEGLTPNFLGKNEFSQKIRIDYGWWRVERGGLPRAQSSMSPVFLFDQVLACTESATSPLPDRYLKVFDYVSVTDCATGSARESELYPLIVVQCFNYSIFGEFLY